MRAQRIKCPMDALTAEGALIYDENVSGKRLGASVLAPAAWGQEVLAKKRLDAPSFGSADGYIGSHPKHRKRGQNDSQMTKANLPSLIGPGSP